MKPICILTLGALVVGCHLDKLVGGSGGGSPPPPPSHGTPVGLAFMTQPRTAQAGQPIGPVQVSIVDSAGHPVAGVDTTTVVIALDQNPGGATLQGTTTTHPVNGVATFSNLFLNTAGSGYTLKASAAGLSVSSGPSAPFDITAPPPTTGTLNVTTNTTANPPASGYTVTVSGAGSQAIGASATVTFAGLSAGSHTVTLSNVPSSCTVTGGATQTTTITANQTQTATFTITCTPPPPTTGDIAVTTSTSGPSQPSGYSVALDGGAAQSIAASGTYTFQSVPAGSHTVTLSGAPANCTVSGGTSRTLTVSVGGIAMATFSVTCVAPPPATGDLIITTATTGSNFPSGYTFSVDGGASQSIGLNDRVTVAAVSASTHSVTLSGVPSNCTVSPGSSQNATVPAGGQVTAPFAISCTAPPPPVYHAPVVNAGGNQTILIGSFTLNASFTDQDNDGPWTYTIDWGDGSSTNGTATSQGAITGTHSYGSVSTNTLKVTVTDSHGLSGSDVATITVVVSLP
jgi:PKD domain